METGAIPDYSKLGAGHDSWDMADRPKTLPPLLPYFPIDNAHIMYTVHPVFFRSHELVV
jgi:hypothetical protein